VFSSREGHPRRFVPRSMNRVPGTPGYPTSSPSSARFACRRQASAPTRRDRIRERSKGRRCYPNPPPTRLMDGIRLRGDDQESTERRQATTTSRGHSEREFLVRVGVGMLRQVTLLR